MTYINSEIIETMIEQIDRDGVVEMAHAYVTSSVETVRHLEAAVSRHDREAIQSLAHQLKGASGTLGMEPLMALAKSIEFACREGRLGEAEELTRDRLPQCFEATLEELYAHVPEVKNV